jgi:hypothetical protein
MDKKNELDSRSRRHFLCGTALAASALAVPGLAMSSGEGDAIKESLRQPRRYVRRNLLAADFPADVLSTYRLAVSKMMALPYSDPRNWYRQGIIHLLDCPHANWWFLPWHRAYLGWFEQICRELTGRDDFALPYWDWTASPEVPSAFFRGELDPTGGLFFSSTSAFEQAMRMPMTNYWNMLTAIQREQLQIRGYSSFDEFWSSMVQSVYFGSEARILSVEAPEFNEVTRNAVSLETLKSAFAQRAFAEFGSGDASGHSLGGRAGILEGRPHNLVHNGIGGLMGDFLSPFDPVFWLHHANVDRLWSNWTQLQREENLPLLPEGNALTAWRTEPFAFFVDATGQPIQGYDTVDYASDDLFGYEYNGGTTIDARLPPVRMGEDRFDAAIEQPDIEVGHAAIASVQMPAELLRQTASSDGPTLVAMVDIGSVSNSAAWDFRLLVVGSKGSSQKEPAGVFQVFGSRGPHHQAAGAVRFSLPLSQAVRTLYQAGQLDPERPLALSMEISPRTGQAGHNDQMQLSSLHVLVR